MNSLNIVLFGPPGAGKGTQADLLVDHYKILHISTGEVIRGEVNAKTELGMKVKGYIEKGQLAPDELVISIIADYLEHHKDSTGSIFDGFPRTTPQAEAFDKMLKAHGQDVTLMVSLNVPDEELIKRLLLRGKDSGRADDSNEEVIKNRIAVYKAQTAVVADYYKTQGKYREINGVGSVETIQKRLCEAIDNFSK